MPENAENLICDFLKTLHSEYTFKSASLKGDTGQIIILGGLDTEKNYFCNDYTKLFIKCLEKVHLPDPKILLRCSTAISKFAIYMKGGIKEGIFQLQMNVLSYAQLVDAKAHPEKYPNLIVRVWGFSAYFNDLPEEYKDNLIRRAKEMEMVG